MVQKESVRGATTPAETASAAGADEETEYNHWDADGTIPESSRSGWTDEKHSMYLQSMETSFIQDLYNKDYSLNELLGWAAPQAEIKMDLLTSDVNDLHPDQFKVHGKGCWRTLKFEKACKPAHLGKEFSKLSTNPWIRHFGGPSSHKGVHHVHCAEELPNCSVDNYRQESIGNNTEVSDQNFIETNGGAKERRKTCKKRRTKSVVRGANGKDQVVP